MYDIPADKDWNPQPASFDSGFLDPVYLSRIHTVEDGTYLAFLGGLGQPVSAGKLVHLSDLFVQGHPRKKVVDFLFGFVFLGAAADRKGGRRSHKVFEYSHLQILAYYFQSFFVNLFQSRHSGVVAHSLVPVDNHATVL